MGWSTTSDLDLFVATAGGYLSSRVAENTPLLAAARAARPASAGRPQGAGPLYGWWTPADGGEPRGAFVHDPAAPLLISGRAPEMAATLAGTLARLGRGVYGVDAPTEAADAFAAVWSQRAGTAVTGHRARRVYRLTAAGATPQAAPGAAGAWPSPELPGPPGRLRVAAAEDHAMLASWLGAAAIETAQRLASPSDLAADLISYGGAAFWEAPGRPGRFRHAAHSLAIPLLRDMAQAGAPAPQPVSLATLTRPVAGTVQIAMLYTLPDHRRSGYARALTQAVSRALLRGGGRDEALPGLLGHGCVREVVLITGVSHPDRWGGQFRYQLVSERSVLRFGPATGPLPRLPRFRR